MNLFFVSVAKSFKVLLKKSCPVPFSFSSETWHLYGTDEISQRDFDDSLSAKRINHGFVSFRFVSGNRRRTN